MEDAVKRSFLDRKSSHDGATKCFNQEGTEDGSSPKKVRKTIQRGLRKPRTPKKGKDTTGETPGLNTGIVKYLPKV